ncbi:endonuclease/exonuclease/phosphatase family protein [Algibacter sp. L1A34]|uniref:endonuclease/exonuclease/phosphatase family protein n=1 Tax=Algibacter sp. L1A34 TaxID=2686365 RepID=UPI001E3A5C38|nr:endonuclease/exonuclease/phosphatase family protein [Algibacter sp. L1A34]
MSCNNEIKKEGQNLKMMTYNIRLDVASDGDNAWPNRKDFLSEQVLFNSPDILGVQEAKPNQMADLKRALTGYNAIGVGRDGKNIGEFSAIFYNAEKLKVENENTFWLSETPNQISKGWDAAYPRICTYGLFTNLENNTKFWVLNTHLDHKGHEAQLQGVALIQDKIKALNTNNLPIVLMGDFNAEPNTELITELRQSMDDSKGLAKVIFGSNGTFNGFKTEKLVTRRIDYIFVSKTNIEVEKYGVLSSLVDLKYPSDHFPVLTELIIK